MNTIPSTSKNVRASYTVAGGTKVSIPPGRSGMISLLLLNRGMRVYRNNLFTDISRFGFPEVISLEGPKAGYDVEELAGRFQNVKFLLLHQEAGIGEQINIGMEESSGRYVLVIWNDMKIQQVTALAKAVERFEDEGILAIVPVLQNQKQQIIPSLLTPAFYRKGLKILSFQPGSDGACTLFPFDYCGLYNREKFMLTGGFDYTIAGSYWQKMDFGFRTYLWGGRIICNTGMQFRYTVDVPAEDTSPDEGYRRFFLKNLIPRFEGDQGRIPAMRVLPFCLKSGIGFVQAVREFREVRRWVDLNKYRFKMDARSVTELWELPES